MRVELFSQGYSYASSLSSTLSETRVDEGQDRRLEEERIREESQDLSGVDVGVNVSGSLVDVVV